MQIVFNCGAHSTNCNRVMQTMQKNQTWLDSNRIEAIPPKRHSSLFGNAINSLNGGVATEEMEDLLLDSLLMSKDTQRAIMATPGLLGTPNQVIGKAGLYPTIGSRLAALANLFPSCDVEFFLAIRNPATLLSEVMEEVPIKDQNTFLSSCFYYQIRWNDTIRRLVKALQGQRLVIWCYEDLPLIWPEVMRNLISMPQDVGLQGNLIYMHDLLNKAGLEKLSEEMSARDQISIAARRALHSHLLQEYQVEDAIEQEIYLPGWTQEIVDEVSQKYYSDIAEIAVLPGVEFIMP